MKERRQLIVGIALVAVGIVVAIIGGVLVHVAEAPEVNEFGEELFSGFPRGWVVATIAQSISLSGFLLLMAGLVFGFVYGRTLTWARAMLGALVFAGLMFVIFAVIPNQMLNIFQTNLEWTPQKIFIGPGGTLDFAVPGDISISYAALKDMIVAGYTTTMLVVVPIAMYWYQERAKKADEPKPEPVSRYGRPLRAPSGANG